MSLLKKLLKIYGAFAILNTLYKLLILWYQRYRAKVLWKHIKGEDSDFFATKLRSYGNNYSEFFAEYCINYPSEDLVKVPIPRPMLCCNSAKSIKWMLKDEFQHITKPGETIETWRLLHEFLGSNGIFVLKHGSSHKELHKMWFKQRKVASLIFTKSNFNDTFYSTFVKKGENFINKLRSCEGSEIDLQSLFFSFTMDSIEKFFMGTEVDTIEGGMSEYAKNFDDAHRSLLKNLFDNIYFILISKFLLPFPFGILHFGHQTTSSLLMKFIYPLSSTYQKFRKSVKKLDEQIYAYIKRTRADPKLKNRKDLMANFLNSKIGEDLEDKTLRDIVLNLTLAGRDTTACTLSWMFFELMKNIDVQIKLQEEIDIKLKGKLPAVKDLEPENMPYLNGVVYESLRLHSPVPYNTKIVQKDIRYLDGTLIPAGTDLIYVPYGIGRNPIKFPDPESFKPERWIPFEKPNDYELPIFQAGPRFCLGKDMAQLEMKLLTVMLLQKFSFKLKAGEVDKVTYSLMFTKSIATDSSKEPSELWSIPISRKHVVQK